MKLEDIKKIAVLGAGTMGPGIAQVYATGGYEVVMWTRSESTRDKALASLKSQFDTFVEEGGIRERMTAARLGRRQTQNQEIAALRAEVTALRAENADLKARLEQLTQKT